MSLYNETGGRPIPPTPVVGCVGLVRDITRIPSRWRRGDRIFVLRGEPARLIRFLWRNAHIFTLAHDVWGGGLERALAEAAAWSRVEPSVVTPCRVGSVAVVVACGAGTQPSWDDVVELGEV